jgi:small subunit ribosomal protein S4e
MKEAKTIVSKGNVLVNGRARKEKAFPLGLMDVISIPKAKASWRVLTDKKGLTLHPIKKDEASFRLCRIENKTIVGQGGVQLNLHDGNNILVRFAEPSEDAFKPLDVIRLGISSGEVEGHLKLGKAAFALIIGGKNRGKYGKVVEIEKAPGKKRRQLVATVEDFAKKRVKTILDFIFVVGGDEPLISLPEVK